MADRVYDFTVPPDVRVHWVSRREGQRKCGSYATREGPVDNERLLAVGVACGVMVSGKMMGRTNVYAGHPEQVIKAQAHGTWLCVVCACRVPGFDSALLEMRMRDGEQLW